MDPALAVGLGGSAAADRSTPSAPDHRTAYRIAIIAFCAVCIAASFMPVVNVFRKPLDNKDYSLWYQIGGWVLDGKPLYPTEPGVDFPYMYPPFLAVVLFAPLHALGWLPTVLAMVVANSLAWLACILLSVYLATGRALHQHPMLYILPGAAVIPYVWDTFHLGQVNVILLLLMLLAFVALRRARPWSAGALIAAAASIKAFPLMVVGYLVYRRHWAALAATLAFLAVFLVLVPAPVRGFRHNLEELRTWANGMVLNQGAGEQLGQRPLLAFMYGNQSLNALTHRLLRPVRAGEHVTPDGEIPLYVNIADLGPAGAQAVFFALAGGLCLFYILCMPRRARRTAATDAVEFAMLLCLIVLFSPISWTYFYCWLLLPLTVAVQFILTSPPGSTQRRTAIAALSLSLAVSASALTQNFDQTTQALGATTIGSVILFFMLGWTLKRAARPTPPAIAA